MIQNYFKIAWRNLWRNKAFSAINVLGLAVGFACCLLITAFLWDELSYDTFPAKARDIYRVELNLNDKDYYSDVDVAVGQGIKNSFPEVLATTRLSKWSNVFLNNEDKKFKEFSLAMADANFFEMFSMPFAYGDAATALKEPNCIVLSKANAIKYFGTTDALGKTLQVNGAEGKPYRVTGILDELPGKLHFDFGIFISMPEHQRQTWSNVGSYTYLQLQPGADAKKLEAKFPQLVAKYVVPEVQKDMGVSLAEAQKSVNTVKFYLKPLSAIHLYSDNKDELQPNGSVKYLYIFGALAVFILLLACVNFNNLSTAGSIKRSKEVGIRKVMGSGQGSLVRQFLTESVLLSLLAFLLALVITYFSLPYFNQLAGKQISFAFFANYRLLLLSLLVVVAAGLLAGSYPAFFLSSFNIIRVLKSSTPTQPHSAQSLRSSLIVFQFTISIVLIICTIVVYNQLYYMQHKALGFDKSQAIIINDTHLLNNGEDAFKHQLLQDNRVADVTISRDVPVDLAGTDGTQAYVKKQTAHQSNADIHINKYHVDYDYLRTLGIAVVKGRDFSTSFSTDSTAILINETAVKDFGLQGTDPIGRTVVFSGQHEYHIIGVVKDFHYTSIKQKIAPLLIMLGHNYGAMIVKVKATDMKDFIADTKKKWLAYNANGPFSYSFLNDRFASVYASEERTGKIFSLFAGISIVIAALGLFGLSAYTTRQRTKEIGVRKVLGATVEQVVLLLSKEFLYLVLIAFMIAIPVTWFAMNQWLKDFAYRVPIGWAAFLLAGVAALVIAFTTVSFQAVKAAIMNPVKSLTEL